MTRHERLNYLGERLMRGDKISNKNKDILELFECSERTLKRYLNELKEKYPQIDTVISDRITFYYLNNDISNIVHEYLSTSDDMSWLIQMINSSDKTIFNKLEDETKKRLERVLSSEKDIFLYQNSPFEVFDSNHGQQIFRALKSAVKNNEYRDIHYNYNNYTILKDVKCLKLIFMENNWYIAIGTKHKETKEDIVLFLRVSFIEKIEYSSKNSYQPSTIQKYNDFFKTFQNPMSLYGVKKKRAIILASPKVAKYFKPNMKKLLTSQQFIEEKEDGSIKFSLDYTQPIEILPLIKKWLPDLKILSPQSLGDTLLNDLKKYIG